MIDKKDFVTMHGTEALRLGILRKCGMSVVLILHLTHFAGMAFGIVFFRIFGGWKKRCNGGFECVPFWQKGDLEAPLRGMNRHSL